MNFSPCVFFTVSPLVEYTVAMFMVFRNLNIILAIKGSRQRRRGCLQMLSLRVQGLFQTEIYSRPIQATAGIHVTLQPYQEWV